jgi:DNA adenine methylase
MIFRYPGGKAKIVDIIVEKINPIYIDNNCDIFIEPFFGSGAVGLKLAQQGLLNEVWFNDMDKGISSIWNAVYYKPNELIEEIEKYKPSVDDFFKFKIELCDQSYLDYGPIVEVALKKIAIHQMSFSGLGTMAGSPIGGKNQIDSDGNLKKYQIDCRWSSKNLIKNIILVNDLFGGLHSRVGGCSFFDYKSVINWSNDIKKKCFYYLDPPYYVMGKQLYQNGFEDEEHVRLSKLLKKQKYWVLSYDDNPFIRKLYNWANIEEVGVNYTINNKGECRELLIYPK